MDVGRPIFVQITEQIENQIIDGSLPEGARAPSTTELAAYHRINPATAAKGISQLVLDGVLQKKRGIGMFVASGARDLLHQRRRDAFAQQYLVPMVAEARKLGLGSEELKSMIDTWNRNDEPAAGASRTEGILSGTPRGTSGAGR